MIKGIGSDIIELARIEKALKHPRFLEKYFTQAEREFFESRCGAVSSIAANFAAKEAVSKALGTGFRGFGPEDIEVLRDELGKPTVSLLGGAKSRMDILGINSIHISLSHHKSSALAFVVAEGVDYESSKL